MNTQPAKNKRAETEEQVLAFWQEKEIFKKAVEKDSPSGDFIFYEGPPTANAKPALHHLEARAFKDVIPRYKTMRGFRVARNAGWDTHGLPVELQIEKKLGLTSKKDIEQYGIAAFNAECKESVFTYIKDWETFTDRIGYWVDKKNAYYTFNNSYIESLWSLVGEVDKKDLLYKDYKIIPWCARCGTALSSHEIAQGYQDVKDLTVTAKFKLVDTPNTSFVAWTTTPWTLPGNVALAVGADITYGTYEKEGERIILATALAEKIVPEGWQKVSECLGQELVGMKYVPLFPYLKDIVSDEQKETLTEAFQVRVAKFVTTQDGTGIVHIAPMYGADDFELGTAYGLPKVHVVGVDGRFVSGTDFLEGRFVKEEDVAVDIIKYLAGEGVLFSKAKYEHSYPHCWRCKTPLLYYARDSWYIAVSKVRDELVANNAEIHWEPAHIKEGRFGEWLRDIKDWAISRERYWGTPLPIWIAEDGERMVVDSIDTIRTYGAKFKNTYTGIRHGVTEYNKQNRWSYANEQHDPLLPEGIAQIKEAAKNLGLVDVIITSPFLRTRQTAEVIAETLGLDASVVETVDAFKEWNPGPEFDDKSNDDFFAAYDYDNAYTYTPAGGESFADIVQRVGKAIVALEEKYQGKNILLVTHGGVLRATDFISQGVSADRFEYLNKDYKNFTNGEFRSFDFVGLPYTENLELDLHKPYIDSVELVKDGKKFTRVKEVMDVWFDSGAMPFASKHYPFENKEYVDTVGFPADFISEAIDQTRGWFYTLHAIGTLLGKGNAYKNVICLGHILDAEGKKMSKSIGNIVDPWEQMDKYGVDTLRLWMYSVNQPGDSKNYDEKTVAELHRQIFGLLYNILSFYELYRDTSLEEQEVQSTNVLDVWITARLNQFITDSTKQLDTYKIFEPVRALRDFIDDFSTWYIRRSRDRIKDGDTEAKSTLYTVLKKLSQVLAPFAPFAAEDIWQTLKTDADAESVHLSTWPAAEAPDEYVLDMMEQTRIICTTGNALRKKVGIPVRQPLAALYIQHAVPPQEYQEIIAAELNVKAVLQKETVENAELDVEITPELRAEGIARELIRLIQDKRKTEGLMPDDRIILSIGTDSRGEEVVQKYTADITKTVGADSVSFVPVEEGLATMIDDIPFSILFS